MKQLKLEIENKIKMLKDDLKNYTNDDTHIYFTNGGIAYLEFVLELIDEGDDE